MADFSAVRNGGGIKQVEKLLDLHLELRNIPVGPRELIAPVSRLPPLVVLLVCLGGVQLLVVKRERLELTHHAKILRERNKLLPGHAHRERFNKTNSIVLDSVFHSRKSILSSKLFSLLFSRTSSSTNMFTLSINCCHQISIS